MSPADSQHLIEPQNDRAVYGEARITEGFTAKACKELVLHKGEHPELLTQLTPESVVDGVRGPFVQVGVPTPGCNRGRLSGYLPGRCLADGRPPGLPTNLGVTGRCNRLPQVHLSQ